MALPKIKRNFDIGRQSEQFLNDELITLYEALKYLPHHKQDHDGKMPDPAKVPGAINAQIPSLDWEDSSLNYWDESKGKWIPFFSKKFQITDHILMETEGDIVPVPGQLWINNGVLCYFDGHQWRPIKAVNIDDSQWSNAAFADFQIVAPLNPTREAVVEVGGRQYVINETVAKDSSVDDYWRYHYMNQLDYQTHNEVITSDESWKPDWFSPELPEPAKTVISDAMRSQFLIPNLKTDKIFLDNRFDQSYDKPPISSICIQYPLKRVMDTDVSVVHINPGKLTNIRKRLVKIDKYNATIAIPPYHTEFYGFRNGEYGGDFLRPSETQDWGDYVPAGDHIILNYNANQNYDYILALTYEFTWMKSDGVVDKKSPDDLSSSFFLSNLRAPVNVHVNGLKLEEASYTVNLDNKTVTIHEDADNVAVNAWSPYKKQFGYIRETDLQNRGIIKLHEPVHVPLVFVGGTLIHPLYGGLKFSEDKQYIYVPNPGGLNQMKNMQWCVVDLVSDDYDVQYGQYGQVEKTIAYYTSGPGDYLDGEDMYYEGTLSDTPDNDGIYDYVLSSGTLHGISGMTIRYDPTKIRPNDGMILFIDGLLVNRDEIIRDDAEGVLTLSSQMLTEDQEYVLLKDIDGAIYDSTNMLPAFAVGYLSDSLIYLNGQLLAEPSCVTTLENPENELKNGIVDNEIRCFITDEIAGTKEWKIYNQYTYQWKDIDDETMLANIAQIVYSYENQLTSVQINVPYNKETDEVVIYSFKFANDITSILNIGTASYWKEDEDTGRPLYKIDGHYTYGKGMLNVYQNGVKLIQAKDYEEMPLGTSFRLLIDADENDVFRYMIEPIEHGQDIGYTRIVLSNEDTMRANIYTVPSYSNVSLYPGRLTVYINGIRIPETDWMLLSDKSIMLRYTDYRAVGSDHNYPEENFIDKDFNKINVTHTYPDQILIEIRHDYDRQEKTIYLPVGADISEIAIDEYELDRKILESPDEIAFYLNGQFAGLSRNDSSDYRLDKYHGKISFMDPGFIQAMSKDEVRDLLYQNDYSYAAWRRRTGKTSYETDRKNALTIVWR